MNDRFYETLICFIIGIYCETIGEAMNALYEEINRLRAENERLSIDLQVGATMLARQCDMAREAERESLASKRENDRLQAEANLNMQEICRLRTDKEEERNISDILDGINQQEICRLRGQVALLRSKIIKKAGKE